MKTTTEKPATRKRVRNISVEDNLTPVQKVQALAAEVFVANREMNEATKKYNASRLDLYAKMKELGLERLDTTAASKDGIAIAVEAIIAAPVGQEVDVNKLQKIVSVEQFLAVVSASQKDVKEKLGEPILNQVLVATTGKETVKVAAKK